MKSLFYGNTFLNTTQFFPYGISIKRNNSLNLIFFLTFKNLENFGMLQLNTDLVGGTRGAAHPLGVFGHGPRSWCPPELNSFKI
jgi:hypothetical protein